MACNHPNYIKLKDGRFMETDCGHCQGCFQKFLSQYTFRMNEEQKKHEFSGYDSSFVLFTYDDAYLPPYGADKDCIQRMIKLFRRYEKLGYYWYSPSGQKNKEKFPFPAHSPSWKYFLVSEYGEQNGRIHYHACFYGLPASDDFKQLWRRLWPYGFVFTRPLRSGGNRYVLKYIEKCRLSSTYVEEYTKRGLNPPFRLFSKGIGMDYFRVNQKTLQKQGGYYVKGRLVRPSHYVCDKFGIYLSPQRKLEMEKKEKKDAFKLGFDDIWQYRSWLRTVREKSLQAKESAKGHVIEDVLSPEYARKRHEAVMNSQK